MPQITKQIPNRVVPAPANKIIQVNGQSAWDDLGSQVRMLLYGQSGSGKTTIWATFPGPILALICSGGNKPGELRSINTPEYRRKIDPQIITSTDRLKELLKLATSGEFKTVVLDHASGLQDMVLKEVLGVDEIPVQKSWGMATQQQYGTVSQQCKEYFRALLSLNCNVVIVAQERIFNDEGTSEIIAPTVGAALIPSLTGWLNPAVDFVVQAFKRPKMMVEKITVAGKTVEQIKRGKGVSYCLRCEPHDVYQTKFRIPKGRPLPDVIIDPDFGKINKLIRGE